MQRRFLFQQLWCLLNYNYFLAVEVATGESSNELEQFALVPQPVDLVEHQDGFFLGMCEQTLDYFAVEAIAQKLVTHVVHHTRQVRLPELFQ
jgi:hypothetical protein